MVVIITRWCDMQTYVLFYKYEINILCWRLSMTTETDMNIREARHVSGANDFKTNST